MHTESDRLTLWEISEHGSMMDTVFAVISHLLNPAGILCDFGCHSGLPLLNDKSHNVSHDLCQEDTL